MLQRLLSQNRKVVTVKKIQINYKALDMIYTAMHGMQRMSSFGQFRTMIGDEALNDLEMRIWFLILRD